MHADIVDIGDCLHSKRANGLEQKPSRSMPILYSHSAGGHFGYIAINESQYAFIFCDLIINKFETIWTDFKVQRKEKKTNVSISHISIYVHIGMECNMHSNLV